MINEYISLVKNFKASKAKLESYTPFYQNLLLNEDRMYRNVCIVGGGSAGYLTALAFRKFFKIPVTLIESSKIPPIGVGEATTPIFGAYLFNVLGLDKKEFYERTQPTWKLGIKFYWGLPGDYYFNYPFDGKDILSAYVHNKDINSSSLNSFLMSSNSSFITRIKDGEETKFHSLAKSLLYAYHIDNETFISYLKEKAIEAGVEFVGAEIIDASLKEDTEDEIDFLISKEGDKFKYEFYVDCSGFRSLLLEKKLKSDYISYESSLFNNKAVVTTLPNQGEIKTYTSAITMDNGWCWNIPLRHEDHIGYVFSSNFCTEDQAYEELLRKNPTMNLDTKIVNFKTGRHKDFVKGNVVAIGNSYAFIEPLESTGLHMIIEEIIMLMNNFFNLKGNPTLRYVLNKDMGAHWDYLRWFLSVHFKYNKKLNTSYWIASRNEVDSTGFDLFVSLYKELGFLSKQDTTLKNAIKNYIKDNLFDLTGLDHILLGQGILPNNIDDVRLDNEEKWQETVEVWKKITSYAIPVKEDLKAMFNKPELM
jgi:tryptophan halogenase